jgi:hypothetical protein
MVVVLLHGHKRSDVDLELDMDLDVDVDLDFDVDARWDGAEDMSHEIFPALWMIPTAKLPFLCWPKSEHDSCAERRRNVPPKNHAPGDRGVTLRVARTTAFRRLEDGMLRR